MYAKVFAQIFDSSIANDYKLRHFFMDLLVLADSDGVVDMTHEAVSARTRIPIEDVITFISQLESPDLKSRTPDHEGRRLIRLDDHRDWGWLIVNYQTFRETATELQRREKTKARVRKHRASKNLKEGGNPVTLCNALVTPLYPSPSPSVSSLEGSLRETKPDNLTTSQCIMLDKSLNRIERRLSELKEADFPKEVEERKQLKAEKKRILGLMNLKA
jgi:hypothetical protein